MRFPRKLLIFSRAYSSKQYESEPYHQHQNKAEQCYRVVKRYINTLMNLTGAPAHCWLLCLVYVCAFLNVTASYSLMESHPFKLLLDKSLTSNMFYIFHSGNLFTTRLMKMSLITSFLHNLMRKEYIELVLLTTKVISLLGRYSTKKPNR